MENKYINLVYKNLNIQVKLDTDGVVVDIFKGEDNVATTWKTYDEFGIDNIKYL